MVFIYQHAERSLEKFEIIAIRKGSLTDFAAYLLSAIFLDLLQRAGPLFLLRHLRAA